MTRRRLPTPCAAPGCPEITVGARCAAHSVRRSRAWPAARRAHLAREPRCRQCGAPATQVDHIIPLARGGPELDPRNLQALCRACHAAKTAGEPR